MMSDECVSVVQSYSRALLHEERRGGYVSKEASLMLKIAEIALRESEEAAGPAAPAGALTPLALPTSLEQGDDDEHDGDGDNDYDDEEDDDYNDGDNDDDDMI